MEFTPIISLQDPSSDQEKVIMEINNSFAEPHLKKAVPDKNSSCTPSSVSKCGGDVITKVTLLKDKKKGIVQMEPFRLACLPFNSRTTLAKIKKDLHLRQLSYFEEKVYANALTIENVYGRKTLSFLVVPSNNPNTLNIIPRSGIIHPGQTVQIIVTSHLTSRSFDEIENEFLNIYISPCTILDLLEAGKSKSSQTSQCWDKVNEEHIEDLWNYYPSPWFPEAEEHQVKILPSDPSYLECRKTFEFGRLVKLVWDKSKNYGLRVMGYLTDLEPEMDEMWNKINFYKAIKVSQSNDERKIEKTKHDLIVKKSSFKIKMTKFFLCALIIWWAITVWMEDKLICTCKC